MAKQDFYEVLGVSKSADADELKKAYRKLAMQYHPDRNPGDKSAEQKFKEISEAYDVLKDDQKRAAYDRFGHAAFENGGRGPGDFGFGGGFSRRLRRHLRRDVRRVMGGRPAAARRAGARQRPALQPRDLARGSLHAASRRRSASPPSSPAKPARAAAPSRARGRSRCPTCHGHGRVRASRASSRSSAPARPARAPASVIENPCKSCGGQGRVRKEKTLSVNIPPGVEDGTRIRLAGEGEVGPARRAAGRSLHLRQHRAAPRSSSATAPISSAGCRSR